MPSQIFSIPHLQKFRMIPICSACFLLIDPLPFSLPFFFSEAAASVTAVAFLPQNRTRKTPLKAPKNQINKKTGQNLSSSRFPFWRSRRDLNPRYPFGVHTISSRARYDHFDTAPCLRLSRADFDILQQTFRFVKH